jgi:hypothetical protein
MGGAERRPKRSSPEWRLQGATAVKTAVNRPGAGHSGAGAAAFPEEKRSRPRVSNPEPAVYKTAALPIELGRREDLNATYSSVFFFTRGFVTRFFGAVFSVGAAASTDSSSLISFSTADATAS